MFNDDLLEFVDKVEPIRLRSLGSASEVEISRAFMRRSRRILDYPSETMLIPVVWCDWYFSMSEYAEMPQQGDSILDSEQNFWTIYNAVPSKANGTWRCVTFRYDVRFGLDEYVDFLAEKIISPENKDEESISEYSILRVGVLAKFSPSTVTYNPSDKSLSPLESFFALTREIPEMEKIRAIRRADGKIYDLKTLKKPAIPSSWVEIYVQRRLS